MIATAALGAGCLLAGVVCWAVSSAAAPSVLPVRSVVPFVAADAPRDTPPNKVVVRNTSTYVDEAGFWIVGEVANGFAAPAQFIELEAVFLSGAGDILATVVQGVALDTVAPGGDSPFAIFRAGVHPDIADVQIKSINFSFLAVGENPPTTGLDIVVTGSTSATAGQMRFTGTATNYSRTKYGALRVVVAVYGASGDVLRVGDAPMAPATLSPGGTGYFEVSVGAVGAAGVMQRFWVAGQSLDGTACHTFPGEPVPPC